MPKAYNSEIIGASSRWVEAGNRSHHRLAPGYAQHLAQAGHDTWFPRGQDASKFFDDSIILDERNYSHSS